MPLHKRWEHELQILTWRGKAKGQCRCGKQSEVVSVDDSHTITEWHNKHTGLVEKPGR